VSEVIKGNQTGVESLKLNVNGHPAHYLKAGIGPPVVLIHGGASDSRDWMHTMINLSHGYSLYAPDLIGFGQSDRNQDGYYLSDFNDFILGFVETLGLERPFLVGHSFGGRLCLEIALQHPEKVRKLVLVDASGLGKISRLGNVVLTGFWVIRKLLRHEQPYPKFLAREGENLQWLCVDELPKLRIPTLLIWKRHDVYLPLTIARRAEKLIPGAKLAVLPGFGHAPHGQNSKAFNNLLLDFLGHD
jgi:pimeloyl-ACP methyl ester carboxylesterase